MASRRRFSLQWRLFIPLMALLIALIGVMFYYTIRHETDLRTRSLEKDLRNISTTVLTSYYEGRDLQRVVDFINTYNNNTSLDDLRITIYDNDGNVVAHTGTPLSYKDENHNVVPEITSVRDPEIDEVTTIRESYTDHKELIFNVVTSYDGKIQVMTATPSDSPGVERLLKYDSMVWTLVIVLVLVVAVVVYFFTRVITNNVKTLRQFAIDAGAGRLPDPDKISFTHDELGDVSREIITLYRDKDRALQRSHQDHEVAMRAVNKREQLKRQMSNNINHELKTPVGIIKGYLDTILSDPDMPEGLRRSFLQKAQAHAERLTQLLKDVSSITRLDDGSQQVELSDFDFYDLVYSLANDLEMSHINEPLTFEYDIPFDCIVRGNYALLTAALMNLVRNAANYSKGTRMTLRLVGQTDKEYTFSFADDGVGVAPEHLNRLFERFYRIDEGRARKSGGTGLGLPIVKSTITAMGGDISIQNATPHGLEFIFTLPKGEPENA